MVSRTTDGTSDIRDTNIRLLEVLGNLTDSSSIMAVVEIAAEYLDVRRYVELAWPRLL